MRRFPKLHRRNLEVLSCPGGNAPARRDTAGQRYSFDSRIIDDLVRLLMRDQQIRIQSDRRTRINPELLKGDGALRYAARVLHHDDVARHHVRTGDSRQLIERKVPGLDAEDHADRAALHVGCSDCRMKLFRSQEAFAIFSVVGENVRTEIHFTTSFVDQLAHLQRCQMRELVNLGVHKFGRLCHDHCPLCIRRLLPGLVSLCGSGKLGFELLRRLAQGTS